MNRLISAALAAVLLSACAQLSTVKNLEPVPPAGGTVSSTNFPTDKDQRADPEAALSRYLGVAAGAWADLKREPSNAGALQLYNYSVGRVVSLVQETGKLPRAGAVTIGTV